MNGPVRPPARALSGQPSSSRRSSRQSLPEAGTHGARPAPTFSAAAIARSELGRHYWGARQQTDLTEQMVEAEIRMASRRREWQATIRRRQELERREWQRRRELARKAKGERLETGASPE